MDLLDEVTIQPEARHAEPKERRIAVGLALRRQHTRRRPRSALSYGFPFDKQNRMTLRNFSCYRKADYSAADHHNIGHSAILHAGAGPVLWRRAHRAVLAVRRFATFLLPLGSPTPVL